MVTQSRVRRVFRLIEGFESPYGTELLSSVHWVATTTPEAKQSPEAAIDAVQRWSPRKRRIMKPEHVRLAWQRLKEQGWLN